MNRLFLFILFTLPLLAQEAHPGKATYDKYCVQCHGEQGDGNGYAYPYVLPKPRDFTTAVFKFRSTGNEFLPLDKDIVRSITDGIPGTSMPAFSHIGADKIQQVTEYIKIFYQDRIDQDTADGNYPAQDLTQSTPPTITDEMLSEGKQLYIDNGCIDCHGYDGRADGPSALTLIDDAGDPIKAANLTNGWRFRGGGSMADIYRAFSTGLAGTPMPTYYDSMTEQQRWAIAAYVHGMGPEAAPEASPQVVGLMVEGDLPTEVTDEAWQQAEQAFFPLTAQVMWEPLNTDPTVLGVHVRALYNEEEVAMLLEWDDPSFSVFQEVTEEASEEDDFWGEEEETPAEEEEDFWGDEEDEASESEPTAILNDGFAIQFPSGLPKGNERPYFVMGDGKYPVNLWRWTNDSNAVIEKKVENDGSDPWARYYREYRGSVTLANQLGKGRDAVEELASGEALPASIRYVNGRYSMVVKRKLSSAEGKEVQLVPGQFVPIAFWAWDGHNAEEGPKGLVEFMVFHRSGKAHSSIGLCEDRGGCSIGGYSAIGCRAYDR